MRPDPDDLPMPFEVLAEHLRRRRAEPCPDPLQPVPRREPAPTTDDLARQLLAESAARPLESGELLLVSEDAVLADLEAAAAGIAPAASSPETSPDDPVLAALTSPRLLSPRVWAVMDWQPPLAEHLRLLEAILLAGRAVPQTMLVGHVETLPERVEHLVRLRDLVRAAATAGGRVVLDVRQAGAADLPPSSPRLEEILAAARPADADTDRRHAVALARLALGPEAVLVG